MTVEVKLELQVWFKPTEELDFGDPGVHLPPGSESESLSVLKTVEHHMVAFLLYLLAALVQRLALIKFIALLCANS